MAKEPKQVTIFACVKLRDEDKASCSHYGSREILRQIQTDLSSAGLQEHVIVRPSGCLKKCKKGPVLAVFAQKGEPFKKPPRKAWKKADLRFKRVKSETLSEVLDDLKSLLKR